MTESMPFDPNAIGQKHLGIFGLPFTVEDAQTVVLPVPWEVTTSYGGGTAQGPQAILDASYQVDLYHPDFANAWETGLAMAPISEYWVEKNAALKPKAQQIIEALEEGQNIEENESLQSILEEINAASFELNNWVKEQTLLYLEQGKNVVLLGGEHSTPLGYYHAMADHYGSYGILHIDAHMDLRIAYEGFEYSHASIMYNALASTHAINRLVQVGVRDYCEEEAQAVLQSKGRIKTFSDLDIRKDLYSGKTWQSICKKIVNALPKNVLISFDIDGLKPSLCPHTGTPVPGGLEFEEVMYLLSMVSSSRAIIGFDLVEVSPGTLDLDANVGARALYHLFGYMLTSKEIE